MRTENRNSAIETLKIIAMFAIVASHVCQHWTNIEKINAYARYLDCALPLATATCDIQTLLCAILRYGGAAGNSVFFVCSCWFLLDSKKTYAKKIVFMLTEVWVVSALILAAICGGRRILGGDGGG